MLVERVETRRHPPKAIVNGCYGEGIVQGGGKPSQTRIRWYCVRLTEGPPIHNITKHRDTSKA